MKIELKEDLLNDLQEYLKDTSFRDLNELAAFILRDYLEKNNSVNAAKSNKDSEKDILQERLKNLGYL